ncbi:MAG: aldehyde ferredoxin oxidoreductase family protein [Methanosarcinales archaeon]|nr:aldehyde ferredoxin oxidoreductase family protein [Methanosarcinales archaeon]
MWSKVLYIDLDTGEHTIRDRADLFDKYLGGTGVATQLLLEECPVGVDPLSPQAPIIISIGPLTALLPCASKAVSMFKSPLTNELGESHVGGRLAMAMRFAGYDSIVIKGRSDKPSYLSIHDEEVKVKDAASIWDVSSIEVTGQILRNVEPGKGRRSIMRIGEGGVNQVRYANVNVDTYRHFGRLGLGAVFGSKNLKAMVISGTEEIEIPDMSAFKKMYNKLYNSVVDTDVMDKYHDLGTAANINVLNQLKGLPTKNLKQSHFENAESLSGEYFADNLLFRKIACSNCPIGCIHIATLKTQFHKGHEFEFRHISYDYELIYALGTNLGIALAEDVLRLIDRCERYSLDVLSVGGVLAWATEAYERDLITPSDTLGIALRWGDTDKYLKALDQIVKMPNKFYQALAKGTAVAAAEYGGEDYAINLAGVEIAGYHTGPASIIGQIVGVRHSHLDNGGYSIDQKASSQQLTEEKMVDKIIYEDYWRMVNNSLVCCLFARGVYSEQIMIDSLASVGIIKTRDELEALGKEIFLAKYQFKKQEGFDLSRIKVPSRFYETVSQLGKVTPETIDNMLTLYREKTGV